MNFFNRIRSGWNKVRSGLSNFVNTSASKIDTGVRNAGGWLSNIYSRVSHYNPTASISNAFNSAFNQPSQAAAPPPSTSRRTTSESYPYANNNNTINIPSVPTTSAGSTPSTYSPSYTYGGDATVNPGGTSGYYYPAVTNPSTTGGSGGYSYTPPPPPPPQGATGQSYNFSLPTGNYTSTPSGFNNIMPTTGTTGETTNNTFKNSYIYPQGETGTSSGIAAHTGLLSGVASGLGLPPQTNAENKKKNTIIIPQGATLSGLSQQYGIPINQLLSANPQITNPNLIYAGKPLNIPSITNKEGQIDLGKVAGGNKEIGNTDKSGLIEISKSDLEKLIQQAKDKALADAKKTQPLPPEPMLKPEAVAQNQDQLDSLYSTEKKAYEDAQRELGIPKAITDYENAIKELNASNQAYDTIVKKINDDPNFPKGLAKRRIATVMEEKNKSETALRNKIALLQTSLQLKGQELSQRLGMIRESANRTYNTQRQQQANTQSNAQDQIKMLINSGGIANMSDAQLQQLAQTGGYTLDSLQRIREAVKTGNIQQAQNEALKQTNTANQRDQQIRRNIISNINSAKTTYEKNPNGYREKLINALTNAYGENYKDYITGQVYDLLPDIGNGENDNLSSKDIEEKFTDVFGKYKKQGYNVATTIQVFMSPKQNNLSDPDQIPQTAQNAFRKVFGSDNYDWAVKAIKEPDKYIVKNDGIYEKKWSPTRDISTWTRKREVKIHSF